ncbi:MAG: replication initiation protein [Sulfurovaceae bacterium]|nr:replication initiation protein [Sulfurovaceae bacterium]
METNLTNRNFIRPSHFIVNGKYRLTTAEINVLLTLLTAIDKDDKDFKDYNFTLSEFNQKTNKSMTSTDLKSVAESIMSKPITINISDKKWKIFNWFSYFDYDNGVITCRFDKALKPYLLGIKERFVIGDLKSLLIMKSSYSKRIYLLLKEYSKIGKRTFQVEELQEVLKTPKSMKRYDNFKRQVLKRAEADINKFTDLEVKLSEKKRGRKVIEVTYTIKKNHADLKALISHIREFYVNELLFYTKDNRPLKCSEHGLLYYADNNQNIKKEDSLKLWEYLHENRENLYIFKADEEMEKKLYLSTLGAFKEYIKENYSNKKIITAKDTYTKEKMIISIFPNGRLYDMNGKNFDDERIHKLWTDIYELAKNDKLPILKTEEQKK